jgi:hypothetical protein
MLYKPFTECRGLSCNNPVSDPGGPGFKSQSRGLSSYVLWLLSVHIENYRIVTLIRPHPPSSTAFPTYHSLIIPHFDAVYTEAFAAFLKPISNLNK